MVARGRLWMAALPLPEFFETFYLFTQPVYAGVYFPGTAVAYAPSIWLNVPPWAWAALITGGCVGMIYRVFLDLTDGVWAMLAALLLLALPAIHLLSLMVMSHPLALFLELLMVWSWLQWRRDRGIAWAALTGALAGWSAITRPLDALCFAIPLGTAMLWEMRTIGPRKIAGTILAIGLAAAPFISVQLAFDRKVTGHVLQTPVTLWDHLDAPQWLVGRSKTDPAFRPALQLPQMRQFYDDFIVPGVADVVQKGALRTWLSKRLPSTLKNGVPTTLLLVFAPLGLLAIRDRRTWVIVAGLPLFVALYMFYPPFLSHYALVAAPAVLLLVVLGARELALVFASPRRSADAAIAIALAVIALTSLTEFNPWLRDPHVDAPVLADIDRKLSDLSTPAVVLFHFEPGNDPNEEPVYNTDVAWPDDARIIRRPRSRRPERPPLPLLRRSFSPADDLSIRREHV